MVVKDCVNTWCKYHNGFYCQEKCGLYIPIGTVLENIDKQKLKAKDYAIYHNNNLVDRGTFENIIKGYEKEIVKGSIYDRNTFCIAI